MSETEDVQVTGNNQNNDEAQKRADKYKERLSEMGFVARTLVQRAVADLKVRKDWNEVLDTTASIISHINTFNALAENDNFVKFVGTPPKSVDEVKIPHEFSFLIIPQSIRLEPQDKKTTNLRVVPKFSCLNFKVKSYNEYLDDIDKFRGYFRMTGEDNIDMLGSLRKHVSFFDVMNKMCIVKGSDKVSDETLLKSRVHYFTDYFWPYFVTDKVDVLYKDAYWNTKFEDLGSDYLTEIHFAK